MYDYILDKTYSESRYWLLSSYDFTKLLCCMSSQPWENIELILKLSMALTSKWDTKVVICSLWIGSLLIKTSVIDILKISAMISHVIETVCPLGWS